MLIKLSTQLPDMNTTEQNEDASFQFPFTNDEPNVSQTTSSANACYPSRDRRPPDRLGYK